MRLPQHLSSDQHRPKGSSTFEVETLVGSILFVGVTISSALLIVGLVWHWMTTGHFDLDYPSFAQFLLIDLHQLFSNALQPRSLINLGLAILMVTPYVRVFASIVYFAFIERNWKYSVFTSFVFAVLTYSLLKS